MRQLSVTLEIVTPLFLAGSNNQEPELRPPSVRGQLRYWLRAALGAVVGNDLKSLKQAEAEVLGDTNGTGAVQIKRMRWLGESPEIVKKNALPHPSARQAWMWGFPEGKNFELVLTQYIPNDETWLAAISALLLMVSFGGLGRRCRRGWGTVRIVDGDLSKASLAEGWHELIKSRPLSEKSWQVFLQKVVKVTQFSLKPLLSDLSIPERKANFAKYTILAPTLVTNFFSKKLYPSYETAISDFGEVEHQCLKDGRLPKLSVGFVQPNRQASPLWLRVIPVEAKNEQPQYIILATLFDIDFQGKDFNAVKKFLTEYANFREIPR